MAGERIRLAPPERRELQSRLRSQVLRAGRLIWSLDIAMPKSGNITEVQVDANAGTVVSTVIETPADQAKEAAADRKVKK